MRYFNVAGSDKKLRSGFNINKGYNLILNLCAASIKKKFIINGDNYKTPDGTPIRDYIHVEDLAKIHLLCADLILKKFLQLLIAVMVMAFLCWKFKKFNLLSSNKIEHIVGKEEKVI